MAKKGAEELAGAEVEEKESNKGLVADDVAGEHPYDFHVSGPRNFCTPSWKDLIHSSWKDPNYKRMVMACFVQAVYLLELDRQDKRTEENGLASRWWKPFKYKVTQTLVDQRDGSIYGAILEWDRSSALSDLVLLRPSGAPKAVLALRGTVLKSPTTRRDVEDDLRFFVLESLKGSVRFGGALDALELGVNKFGSNNVCIAGHSLGAGFALQIGKALAKKSVFVECHLFNPPSISLTMSLRVLGEKAVSFWKGIKAAKSKNDGEILIMKEESEVIEAEVKSVYKEAERWVPNLYVNNSDYICCYYNDDIRDDTDTKANKVKIASGHVDVAAKILVASKGPKKFLEAHGLQQWWAEDVELRLALNDSKLINRQLRSLYELPLQKSS